MSDVIIATGHTQAVEPHEPACLHALDRRTFLHRAALTAVAALVSSGLAPTLAMAERVAPLAPRAASRVLSAPTTFRRRMAFSWTRPANSPSRA